MRYDIQTLRAFVAVAEEGSITLGAARELTVISAVSKRISEMEDLCGVTLLNRHRRGVSLTPAGVEMLAHAKRVLDELNRLDNTMKDFSNGARGQVRVLANTSSIVQFLPSDFASFIAKHPTIKLDLEERTSDEIQKNLLAGLADIGILIAEKPIAGLNLMHYKRDELVCVLPIDHPLSQKNQIKFSEVLEFDLVGLPRGTSLCDLLTEKAARLDLNLKLRIQARSYEGLVHMVQSGIGISLLPLGSVTPFLDARRIVARPLFEAWAKREQKLAVKADQPLTAVASLLLKHLASGDS